METSSNSSTVAFGLLSDIQYANKPDTYIDYVGATRSYDSVLDKTRAAVKSLNTRSLTTVLHLGDIIDGNITAESTIADLDSVLEALSSLDPPVRHVIGNHCLDLGRQYLQSRLKLPSAFYHTDLSSKWRLIVLDTVDVSVRREKNHAYYEQAVSYLADHSGEPNASPWNSAVGPHQMDWLAKLLERTKVDGMFAIVVGHHPICAAAASESHLLWNWTPVADLLATSKVVKAYFCGHYHPGGYATAGGVHHVTVQSVLDSGEGGSFGEVQLSDSEIVIKGVGDFPSRRLAI